MAGSKDGKRRVIGSTGAAGMAQLHQVVPLVERAHALIEQLRVRAPRVTPGPLLAQRMGVSVRTIERDIARLQVAGVPVQVVRGAEGGYRLDTVEHLPAVVFTPGEAAALIAAIAAVGPYSSAAAKTAMGKLVEATTGRSATNERREAEPDLT